MKSDLVDVELHLHHETARAILASADGNRQAAIWLPLSAIEFERKPGSSVITATMPERLALEKGLI